MRWTLIVGLLTSALAWAQVPQTPDNLVFVGNRAQPVVLVHDSNIQQAIFDAQQMSPPGVVVIPPSYTGADSYTAGTILVLDLRNGALGVNGTLTASGFLDLGGSGLDQLISAKPNDGVTGTSAGLLAKLVGNTIVTAGAGGNAYPFVYPAIAAVPGVCAPGTTGNGCIVRLGTAPCSFDVGGATAAHFVGVTTGGKCTDLGSGYPAGACWVGTAAASVASGQSGNINVNPACSLAPSGLATVQIAGVSQTQRTKVNFLGGFTAADNAGNGSTDLTPGQWPLVTGSAGSPSIIVAAFPTAIQFWTAFSGLFLVQGRNGVAQSLWGMGSMDYVRGVGCLLFYPDNTFGAAEGGIGEFAAGVITADNGVACGNALGTFRAAHFKGTTGQIVPQSVGTNQPETFQTGYFGATTATAATAGSSATTTFTWLTAFPDANYHVVCSPSGTITGTPAWQGVTTKSPSQVTVSVIAITNAASSYSGVDCYAFE